MVRSRGALLLASAAVWAACGHDYGSFMLVAADATAAGAGGVTGPADAGPAGTGGMTGPAVGGNAGAPTAGSSAGGGSAAQSCGPGLIWCNGACLSRLNPANCGGCNNSCSAQGLECIDGICGCRRSNECGSRPGATCDTTTTRCNCGSLCGGGETCGASGCSCNGGVACAAGQTCCQTPAGCRDLASDAANCGGCGVVCASGQRCVQGACT